MRPFALLTTTLLGCTTATVQDPARTGDASVHPAEAGPEDAGLLGRWVARHVRRGRFGLHRASTNS